MSDYIHIVSLMAPSPPDFGGAFDLYYKIPALSKAGEKIILHYFNYQEGRGHEGLEAFCEEIYTYERSVFLKSLLTLKPYIVSSRIEPELIHRLNRDDYPVLLEGIHCTGIIPHLRNRKIIVRIHNDEAEYYKNLFESEPNLLKSFYFYYESVLLSQYQKKLSKEAFFAFVSESDQEAFTEKYHLSNSAFVPCFVPWQTIRSKTGKGEYCLYHGNLTVSENVKAAIWLAEFIFPQIDFPLVIAGKNAKALENQLPSTIQLVNNPSDEELSELIENAHINVLPSFNNTGVKLKLIHTLFDGRFCVTNESGITGSGLDAAAVVANDNESTIQLIKELLLKEFSEENMQARKKIMQVYDNATNIEKLIALL